VTPSVHRRCERNFWVLNLLQTPIILWITYRFVKKSMVDVSKHISKMTWNSIHKYGVTIYYDGWDNYAWCLLSNVMFPCPNGNVFISTINKIREHKDAQYICNALVGYIQSIGMDNIGQICINNALNMWNATNLLIFHFLGLCFQGCATHCLNLLLERNMRKLSCNLWKGWKLLFFI
jgi:hypothetical protein